MEYCRSCNTALSKDHISFPCPACGKEKISRCDPCRSVSRTYTCTCGFTGP